MNVPNLTLDQLRVLVTIRDTGSFSAAGRSLGRVQSAISQTVKAVEDAHGVALFDRAKTEGDRRVLPTLFLMTKCAKGPTDCCLANDPAYKDVLRAITSKK